jgi:hypothetical protein
LGREDKERKPLRLNIYWLSLTFGKFSERTSRESEGTAMESENRFAITAAWPITAMKKQLKKYEKQH